MKNSTDPKLIIFGDSHAAALKRGADILGLNCIGGAIFAGREFGRKFFAVKRGEIVLDSKRNQRMFCSPIDDEQSVNKKSILNLPILSTAGFNTHTFANGFRRRGLSIVPTAKHQFVSSGCFDCIVDGARADVLEFYGILIKAGWSVFAALSPQRFHPKWASVARRFELVFSRKLIALGVNIVDVRAETADADGLLQVKFRSGDEMHGNAKYGAIVVRRFLEMVETSCSERLSGADANLAR